MSAAVQATPWFDVADSVEAERAERDDALRVDRWGVALEKLQRVLEVAVRFLGDALTPHRDLGVHNALTTSAKYTRHSDFADRFACASLRLLQKLAELFAPHPVLGRVALNCDDGFFFARIQVCKVRVERPNDSMPSQPVR